MSTPNAVKQRPYRTRDDSKITVEYHRPSREFLQEYYASLNRPFVPPMQAPPPLPSKLEALKSAKGPSSPPVHETRNSVPKASRKRKPSTQTNTPYTPQLPSSFTTNGTGTTRVLATKRKKGITRKKKGILGFLLDLLGLNKRVEISSVYDPVHLTHVGFNAPTGEFTGLPKEWQQQLLQESVISRTEQERDPEAVTEPANSGPAHVRLIRRSFAPHELPSLMETIASSKDERDTIHSLLPHDAQTFIDVIDEALDLPDVPAWVRKKCIQLLYRMCGNHALLPRALKIPPCYDRTRDALYRGGFADVWKGEHGGQEVAVKVLRTYSNSNFEKIVGRFCKEVVMWKFLRHPNVLPLIGVTMSESRFAMISDWMVNGNINEFVKANPYAARHKLLVGVADGLIYIHSEGMIHGDLKGANILIDHAGNPRLADFGLLTIVSDPANVFSSTSYAQGGTARWMAPELIDPKKFGMKDSRPTKSSDCYALGMVIYETVGGRVPFHKDGDLTVFTRVLAGKRPTREPEFAESLWKMMKMCWVPKPSSRPRIEEVLRCLKEVSNL